MMPEKINKNVYKYLLILAFLTILVGTVVYHFVEHFSWIDAYYFSVITLATVGYGDLTPHTVFGKLFTTLYIFVGVGIFTTFITFKLRRRAYKINQSRSKKLK